MADENKPGPDETPAGTPAPGEPGKMPFWKGEGPGRPVELGVAIGKLVRELRKHERGEVRHAGHRKSEKHHKHEKKHHKHHDRD